MAGRDASPAEIQADSSTATTISPQLTPESDSDSDWQGPAGSGIPLRGLKDAATTKHANSPVQAPEGDADQDSDREDVSFHQSSRRTSVQSFELYTPDEERSVRRKIDRNLVLFVALLYLLSFLDRSNIGNAEVAGLKHDLGMTDGQYQWLLRGFYITYILFEWMTLLYRVVPPHAYISLCVAAWGCIASLQAVSTGFTSMLTCRLLLGISEAAFGPGVPFYLSFFYKRNELAFRTGLFISAAPLASSFASSLAYAIVRLGDRTGIQSWRLLLLVEGFPSMIVAVWAWYWIPDSPSTARWLQSREQRIAALRLRSTKQDTARIEKSCPVQGTRRWTRIDWRQIGGTLTDPKSYLTAAIFFSCNVAFSSMPVFAPIIINSIGYSRAAAQGLTALPNLFAFFVVLAVSLTSDRLRTRSIPMVVVALLAMIGYILLALAQTLSLPHVLRYLCLFPITAGFFSAVTLVIVWTLDNQQSAEGKGTGVALLNYIGQLGPFIGTALYPESDGPYYTKGHTVCAFFMAVVAMLAVALRVSLKRQNSKLPVTAYARLNEQRNGSHQEFKFIL